MSLFILFVLFCGFLFLLLQGVAFITLVERHLLSISQGRLGPNNVSMGGLLQPIFDGLNLAKKEFLFPGASFCGGFILFSFLSFLFLVLDWLILPYFYFLLVLSLAYFLLCLFGLFVYCPLLVGVFSKSKYGLIGSIRASSQSVSYEVLFSIFYFYLLFIGGVFIFYFFFVDLLFLIVLFLLLALVECGRAPFDFSEGESELVSGFNIEIGSISFIFCF